MLAILIPALLATLTSAQFDASNNFGAYDTSVTYAPLDTPSSLAERSAETCVRDWMQIGDDRFGMSHVEAYGYPYWGENDDEGPHKGWILRAPASGFSTGGWPRYGSMISERIRSSPNTLSWDHANSYVQGLLDSNGMPGNWRLPTNYEAKEWLSEIGSGPDRQLGGADTWVPTTATYTACAVSAPTSDLERMLLFIESIPVEVRHETWVAVKPVCTWEGVKCDQSETFVVAVKWVGRRLTGELKFALLPPKMMFLYLSDNGFTGTPDLENLPSTMTHLPGSQPVHG